MFKASFVMKVDTLTPALKGFDAAVDAGMDLAFDSMVPVAESYMRTNAPWRDRTGNARAGLKAIHQAQPMVQHSLILFHTMPYGIWLEVRWSGRYAIIAPSVRELGPDLMRRVSDSVTRAIGLLG